jgi:hypothetical protein
MAYLFRTLSARSVPGYMNVVRLMHLEAGFKTPLEDNWEVRMLQKGISRTLGSPLKQKSPVTVDILLALLRTIEDTNFDQSFWCACLMAFFGLLRKLTLLPQSNLLVANKFIARGDVSELTLNSFVFTIKCSKPIQFGQKVHTLPYSVCSDVRLCPIRAMLIHLVLSEIETTSPLFNFLSGGQETFMSHSLFMNRCGLVYVQ